MKGEKEVGTLFDQPVRTLSVRQIIWVAEELGFVGEGGLADVTPEQWQAAAAVATAARHLENSDVHDEQLAGFGEIAQQFVHTLDRIATILEERE